LHLRFFGVKLIKIGLSPLWGGDMYLKEMRREPRQVMIGDVFYTTLNDPIEMSFRGMLFDLSTSGLCIFTHRPLNEGTELRLEGTRLWENAKYAVVKWCKPISTDIYRVGLSLNSTSH